MWELSSSYGTNTRVDFTGQMYFELWIQRPNFERLTLGPARFYSTRDSSFAVLLSLSLPLFWFLLQSKLKHEETIWFNLLSVLCSFLLSDRSSFVFGLRIHERTSAVLHCKSSFILSQKFLLFYLSGCFSFPKVWFLLSHLILMVLFEEGQRFKVFFEDKNSGAQDRWS